MLRDARRASTALVLLVGLTGCAGIGQPAPYDSTGINGLVIPTPEPDPRDFVDGVDNPWFPLDAGATWRYEVTDAGREVGSIEASVLDRTTDIGGVEATGVTTATDIDGVTDVSTRFYAQDADGNGWMVGADDGGKDRGDWRAGEDGAEAGLAMPAHPRLGDGWLTYVVPGQPEASTTVEDQSREMVQTHQSGSAGIGQSEADTTTRNVYARGVGLVSIEDLDSGWQALLLQ
jgi:hypothetical protein